VLVGVLAGVVAGLAMKRGGYGLGKDIVLGLAGSIGLSWLFRATGIFPGAGIGTMVVVASIGAAIPIVAQRKFWPTEQLGEDTADMWWRWGLGAAVVAVVAWMTLGPAPQPAATAAVVDEKTYAVTPASVNVKAGIVTGEVADMKVTERVEQGSNVVVTPAKLTAILRLKNTSADQTVRLVAGKILYIDAQGQPIALENARTDPALRFGSSSEQLDPGQETTQAVDVEFPAEALKAKTLKEIRLALVYVPTPYRQETVNFAVAIGAGK
jgi:uncharacterized membrane protein YeaQ/YmgE (transglycosylase-associated protein family)